MDVDSVLNEHTNTDSTDVTKSDASAQDSTAEKPQATFENIIESELPAEVKRTSNQVSAQETDNTNDPRSDLSVDGSAIDEIQATLENHIECEPLVEENTPNKDPSNETSVIDKQETHSEENVINNESNSNITIDQPIKEHVQEIFMSALECKDTNEVQNIQHDSKDIPMEESNKRLVQQNLDVSLNNDCQIIADPVLMVDLTMDDSITHETSVGQPNVEIKTKNINNDLIDKAGTEKSKVDGSLIPQLPSSKDETVNLQIENQNNSTQLISQETLQQKTQPAQSNPEVEPENVNEVVESKESESSQMEPSQNDSTLSLHTIADQDKTDDLSMEDSTLNETPAEKSNLEVKLKKINQNIDDVPMVECNTNKSFENQQTESSETKPKLDQTNNTADKTEMKDTTTQINVNESTKEYYQAKGAQKRDGEALADSPAAKKPRPFFSLPADLVGLITKNTYTPRNINQWTKLKMVKECQILYLKPIPKSWSHNEMNDFVIDNVKCINDTHKVCYFFFMRDAQFKTTGECLIKFRNSDYCHKAWFDMRGVKINNVRVNVQVDLGHNLMKQVRKESKLRAKPVNPSPEVPIKNVYEFVNQNHDDMLQQTQGNEDNSNPAKNSAVNSGGVINNVANANYSPSKTDGASTSGTQNIETSNSHYVQVKPSYMPAEKFDKTTYGLNEGFLQSLGLKVPLCNVIIVIGVEFDVSDDKIKEVFSLAGTVKRAFRVMKKDGSPTWKAIVEYDHPVEAVQAVSMFHGKALYGRHLIIKMAPKSFPRPLPAGLAEVGAGLGPEGEPMRGVRAQVELQSLRKMLIDLKNMFDKKIADIEKALAAQISKIDALPRIPEKAPVPPKKPTPAPTSQESQSHATDAATQLVKALSSLAQPNVLMGLNTLLSAQGFVQQGVGADQAAMMNAMQNQMMMQNAAYAQNVNMQGMTTQQLPGVYSQPVLTQPGLIQPQVMQQTDQAQMVPTPQSYYGQPQMVQPGFVPIQTVPTPAPVAPVEQVIPLQPQASNTNQTQPAQNQQTPAYTPKVVQVEGTSKNKAASSKWDKAPVSAPVAQKPKAAEPKPAYVAEPSHYNRPSRFDMKERPNSNLKVIEPEPEMKNDMLVFSNLPSSVTVHALNSKMREVGDVVFGEMTGRGRAIIRFKHARDAERCIKLFNRSKVDGQVINVEYF